MKVALEKNQIVISGTHFQDRMKMAVITGASWDKVRKVWVAPVTSLPEALRAGAIPVDEKPQKEYEKLLRAKDRIDSIKQEFFTDAKKAGDGFLMRHQEMGLSIARCRERYGFYYDTGTGKTIMSLAIIADKPEVRWVVVCPIVLVLNAWMEDAKHFPQVKLLPLTTNVKKEYYMYLCERYEVKYSRFDRKDDLIAKLKEVCDVFLINPESFHKFDIPVEGLIFDESVLLKSPTAKITKQITELSKQLRYVYLLSGEPAPNTEEEYFSQMRIINPGIFGNTVSRFRDKYFMSLDPMGYRRVMKGHMRDEFFSRINDNAVFVTKEQCLDLPEHTTIPYRFDLSPAVMKEYKQLERLAFLEMKDMTDNAVSLQADMILTKLMKLRQLTSGFLLVDDTTKFIHDEKLSVLHELLEQIGNKQVIIWASFHPEFEMITNLLETMGKTYVTAYGLTADKDDSIQQFASGKADVIVAHPKTLKYGITFTNCTYSIKFSMGHSYDDFKQSQDRINRKGKTLPTTEYVITAVGTIDEGILKAVTGKKDASDLLKDVLYDMARKHESF